MWRASRAIVALAHRELSLAIVLALIALSVLACHPRRVLILVPDSLTHDIGLWADADLICVAVPVYQAAYVPRRCVPMRTIRAVILHTQFALTRETQF